MRYITDKIQGKGRPKMVTLPVQAPPLEGDGFFSTQGPDNE
jgi:hypothetical protein